MGSRTPALLITRQEWARKPPALGGCTPPKLLPAPHRPSQLDSSVQQIDLPVRTLDTHIDLADLPGERIRLTAQFGDRKRGKHHQPWGSWTCSPVCCWPDWARASSSRCCCGSCSPADRAG